MLRNSLQFYTHLELLIVIIVNRWNIPYDCIKFAYNASSFGNNMAVGLIIQYSNGTLLEN